MNGLDVRFTEYTRPEENLKVIRASVEFHSEGRFSTLPALASPTDFENFVKKDLINNLARYVTRRVGYEWETIRPGVDAVYQSVLAATFSNPAALKTLDDIVELLDKKIRDPMIVLPLRAHRNDR